MAGPFPHSSKLRHPLKDATVFLTGATGLIGGEILYKLLSSDVRRVFCLMRDDPVAAAERIRTRLCARIDEHILSEKLSIVSGDAGHPGLGMDDEIRQALRKSVNLVFHCAAITSFLQNRECWKVNFDGTRSLFEFGRDCERKPTIYYFGSSSTCGKLSDKLLKEEDFPFEDNAYFVTYAESKAAVELKLLPQMDDLDIVILRPSMVVPNGTLPKTLKREVAWPLALMQQCSALPLNPKANVDIVPLSYVADYTMRIASSDRRNRCYHLTAGAEGASNVQDMLNIVSENFDGEPIQLLQGPAWDAHAKRLRRRDRIFIRQISPYFPFINQNVTFDNARLFDEFGPAPETTFSLKSHLPELVRSISVSEALQQSRYD